MNAVAAHAPTVLVVEDDPHLAAGVVENLRLEGFTVHHVGDGRAALDWLRRERCELVVLDVMLPYVDGFEIVGLIRAQAGWEAVPVLMLTAKNTERDTVRALDAGANDFIIKPFQPQELLARLRRFLKTAA